MNNIISVIITCYNIEHYIGKAIESVLSQDYKGIVDIIVIDDYSFDSSPDIIKSYPQIRYLRNPSNIGVLLSTVKGLRHCKGDIVFFLDGDDTWRSDKLSICIDAFNNDIFLGFLTHDLSYIDKFGNHINKISQSSKFFLGRSNYGNLVRQGILLHSDYVWLGSAYSIRKSLIDTDAFCAFSESLPDPFNTYQDWPLAYWAACKYDINMNYIPEKLFYYRLHGSNYSGDASNVKKAIRNITRSYNTMIAIDNISYLSSYNKKGLRITRQKSLFQEYLINLYSGNRFISLIKFINIQKYLMSNINIIGKEWIRFIGIMIVGPKYFLKLTKKI